MFSVTGVFAGPDKIDNNSQAERPNSVEKVRSLPQTGTFKTKLIFDRREGISYSAPWADAGQGGEVQVDGGEVGQLPRDEGRQLGAGRQYGRGAVGTLVRLPATNHDNQ